MPLDDPSWSKIRFVEMITKIATWMGTGVDKYQERDELACIPSFCRVEEGVQKVMKERNI